MAKYNMFQNYNNLDNVNYANSNNKVHEYGEEIAQVKNQIERLNVLTEAMWELLKEKGATEEDLLAAIAKIDEEKKMRKKAFEDGTATDEDKATVLCPNCHVPLQNNGNLANRCIYCGHEIISNPFKK